MAAAWTRRSGPAGGRCGWPPRTRSRPASATGRSRAVPGLPDVGRIGGGGTWPRAAGKARLQRSGRGPLQLTPVQPAELEAVLELARRPAGMRISAGRWPGSRTRRAAVRGGVHAGLHGRAAAPARLDRPGPGPPGRRARTGQDRRVAGGDLARGKSTAADLGAWLVFEDQFGQGPGRRKDAPRAAAAAPWSAVTGGSNTRISLAALIAARPGGQPRLIYRTHLGGRWHGQRKGFTETDYARLLDAAHQH